MGRTRESKCGAGEREREREREEGRGRMPKKGESLWVRVFLLNIDRAKTEVARRCACLARSAKLYGCQVCVCVCV